MKSLRVESYAGARAVEYPLRFYIGKRKIEITSIKERWLTPEGRCFKVLGENGRLYVLEYNNDNDAWNLLTINRP